MKKPMIVLVVALLLGACTKKEVSSPLPTGKSGTEQNVSASKGFVNPYDAYGQLHNDLLTEVGNATGFPGTSNAEKWNTIISNPNIDMGSFTFQNASAILTKLESNGLLAFPAFLYDKGKLTATENTFYTGLLTQLSLADTYEDAITIIENTEIEVSESETFTDLEKERFLGSCAIGRYSAQFWQAAASDDTNPWHTISLNPPIDIQALQPNWWKIGADLLGFGVGTVIGGPVIGIGLGGMLSAAA